MTSLNSKQEVEPSKASREPNYEFARREAEIVARFPSGERLSVVRGRARSYPGLPSVAPSTLAFYQTVAPLLDERHVLDAGSGSSAGTRLLCERPAHVTAIDCDPRALEFGREYAPSAEFFQADLGHGLPIDRADAALVVDVLGHLARPAAALRGLRACLPAGSRLFVVEPRAYPSQRLLAPARRAYSKAALERLLLRSGFEVEQVTSGAASFVSLVARRASHVAIDALVEGFQQLERGDAAAARGEFARAQRGEHAGVRLEALLGEAEAAFTANDGDAAVRAYFEANALDIGDGRALAGLARVALVTGEAHDALGLALDAVKRDPTEAPAQIALALAAEQLAHPEASNAWRIACNLCPDDSEVATGLARVSAAKHNYAFAIQVFERLRGYGNAFGPEFHVTLAWLLLADGRKSDASIEAKYAAALAPADAAVGELLGALTQ